MQIFLRRMKDASCYRAENWNDYAQVFSFQKTRTKGDGLVKMERRMERNSAQESESGSLRGKNFYSTSRDVEETAKTN